MARRATAIKSERAKSNDVLVLDAGDTLLGYPISDENDGKIFVEAMNSLNYSAMTLGDQDFRKGLDVLKARISEMKFPALSANVVDSETGQLIAKPYVVQTVAGRKIAIIGLTSPDAERVVKATPAGSALKIVVRDPLETAKEIVPKALTETNAIIILSNLGSAVDMQLAKEVPGITAIIGGHSRELLIPAMQAEASDTLISQAGNLGEHLGVLTLNIDEKGKGSVLRSEAIALTEDFADDVDMVSLLSKYRTPVNQPAEPVKELLPTR